MDSGLKFRGKLHFHDVDEVSDTLRIPYLGINKEIVFETDSCDIWINEESVKFLKTIENIHGVKYEAYQDLGVVKVENRLEIDFGKMSFYSEEGLKVEYAFIGENIGKVRNHENPNTRLCKDFEQLLTDEEFKDVTLQCEGGELKAHKSILSARSKVFKAMFQHEGFLESKSNTVKCYFDLELMKYLLLYIYSAKVTKSKAKELLELADYYDLQQLKDECIYIISEEISSKNKEKVSSDEEAEETESLSREELQEMLNCKMIL